MFESRRHLALLGLRMVAQFGFGGRNVADRLQQPAMGEPVDPFERRELDRLEATPRPPAARSPRPCKVR